MSKRWLTLVSIELHLELLLSNSEALNHVTVYNAASSQKSLGIMLIIAANGTPLVVTYTVFVYKTFRAGTSQCEVHH
ncbi:MAG: cytochrome d ubiquinol oxidase subunit II [Saprospiraceae bacterium]|nr:cytochrome d ubiquinol oxidase subunit II [Saprospiraceae bacterium]